MAVAHIWLCVIVAGLVFPCFCRAGAHPVPVEAQTNCLECHGDHVAAEHIHAAIKQGCAACHSIEAHKDATYVILKHTKPVVCFECHQPETLSQAHFPYASGMCTRCHNPHGSQNSKLLRAKANELCLNCHLLTPQTVPSRYMPTIALTANNTTGHPYARHPVSGTLDPLTGEEMSCMSCHLAHGGGKTHYLKMAAEIPEDALNQNTETKDMCSKCHLRLWGLDGAGGNKKHKKKRPN